MHLARNPTIWTAPCSRHCRTVSSPESLICNKYSSATFVLRTDSVQNPAARCCELSTTPSPLTPLSEARAAAAGRTQTLLSDPRGTNPIPIHQRTPSASRSSEGEQHARAPELVPRTSGAPQAQAPGHGPAGDGGGRWAGWRRSEGLAGCYLCGGRRAVSGCGVRARLGNSRRRIRVAAVAAARQAARQRGQDLVRRFVVRDAGARPKSMVLWVRAWRTPES
jgi:hypothetical protein